MRISPVISRATFALLLAGCTSQQPVVVTATPADPAATAARRGERPRPASGWRIDAREHVDLWLHGFALLQDDVSLVPYFRPGYRPSLQAQRPSGTSALDANRARLTQRLTENPNLTSAQFVALYFASWSDLRRGVERFLADDGELREARNQEEYRMYATLRTYFPAAADRDWLRLFVSALDDERTRFFRAWWLQQEQLRAPIRGEVESLWNGTYAAAFSRFMRGAMPREGAILLSVPLGGEGRTLSVGGRDNFVTVTFPAPGEDPREALHVVAHEVVGVTATATVRDHASAADERSGEAAKWTSLAAVRGGAMLLERIAPELVDGYRRYYLRLARVTVPATDPRAQFAATFPLPAAIGDALRRAIDDVLAGI